MTLLQESSIMCAGRGCKNVATEVLQVAVLNMFGDFCKDCATSLVADGLAQFYNMKEKTALVPASATDSEVIQEWQGRPSK
jgi:hypothetical protein